MLIGELLVFTLILNKMDPFTLGSIHLNAGFVALTINTFIYVVVNEVVYRMKTQTPSVEAEKVS